MHPEASHAASAGPDFVVMVSLCTVHFANTAVRPTARCFLRTSASVDRRVAGGGVMLRCLLLRHHIQEAKCALALAIHAASADRDVVGDRVVLRCPLRRHSNEA